MKGLDKKYNNIMERCMRDGVAIVDTSLAKSFGRNKKVRYLRELGGIYIGNDRKKNKSMIYINNKYFKF